MSRLSKSFAGKQVVCDLSLEGKKGEIIGCIGPNGSGKTTSIRMLCGLITPDSGSGQCLGHDILTEGEKIQGKVGYMAQSFSFYKYLTVYENLRFICNLYHIENPRQRIEHIAERLQLTDHLQLNAGNLSGGWKQKLSLAAAILPAPEILFLDEPTAAVDPETRLKFWLVLEEIAGFGTTIFVSTHYMSELERCQKLLYLSEGRTLTKGYISDILEQTTLSVWSAAGKNLHSLANSLRPLPGVDDIIEYGASIRVIGSDPRLLFNSLRPYILHLDYLWKAESPVLEDIFISMINDIHHD